MRREWLAAVLTLAWAWPSATWADEPPPEVTMPELLEPLQPEYPSMGTGSVRVVLQVTLDREGAVTSVEVVSGGEPYASAAVRAAKNGKFSPALSQGQPVAATITVAVDFTYSAAEAEPEAPRKETERTPPAQSEPKSGQGTPAPAAESEAPIDIVVIAPRRDATERSINRAQARVTAGTFGDPLRAVELLPGITPLISGVPYFFVRGAPAGSVNFYIDEARIPQLYHVGPGSSILHPLFVDAVSLRSGPYRARYGDATSGVITTRVLYDIPEFGAEVEGKVFESLAYVGAPAFGGDGSAAVAGKVSHLGPVLEQIAPELRLHYWDYQSLVAYRPSTRDELTLLVFGAGDFVGEEEGGQVDINIDTVFHRLKVGYNKNLDEGIDLHNYVILGLEGARFNRVGEDFRARSLGAGTALSHVIDRTWEWATGMSMEATDYDASGATNFVGGDSNVSVSRVDTQSALWIEGRVSPIRNVTIDAGHRLAAYTSREAKAIAFEPRLTSTLGLSERTKAILAVGYSTQTPSVAVPAPAVRPADLRGGLQQALQRAATLRYGVPYVVTAEATAFYNDYLDLSDPLSLSTVPDPLEVGDTASGTEPPSEDLNFAERPKGRSYGIELLLRRPFTNALSGSISYTLSRSTRRIGSVNVPSSFDRTHILNTTAGYDFGHGYDASVRFLTYSGLPVRKFGDPAGRTGERTDPFVRLDVRFSKEWRFSWSNLMLIVEMLNATFQKEVLGVSCQAGGCVTATFGPVTVPSVGLRGTFGGARSEGNRADYE